MPRGTPKWLEEAEAGFMREMDERKAREATEPPKVGIDPRTPHHPIFNPSIEEIRRREQSVQESAIASKERHRTPTQEQHWKKAVELIRGGHCQSYEDLGRQFIRSRYDRKAPGQPFSAVWAYRLVQKLIVRGTFTQEEIRRLIPDQTRPFKKCGQRQHCKN